ncbi:RNA methyltransferase [Nakamurella flava]|uniref:RNA methyltransferase n=1 Tax=Nakamurella flava TaxID=2576308 RepID=A0A4U6QFZ0_9ACTN|nr:RNA methyltransferase [Nakamurella flava]TKV58936.1 RNA methyltransferase [Nakamurella flava]
MLTERSSRIVAAHKLLRRPRRTEAGQFLAEGAGPVTEAIAAERDRPGTVLELFVTEAAAARHVDLVRSAFAAGVEVTQVTERAAAALSDTVAPQGLVARCALPETDPDELLASSPRLLAVCVETNDPGNLGTIIRLADAAGADGVLVAGDAVDPFNPKTVRATTGSLFHLPVVRVRDRAEAIKALHEAGVSVLATTGTAELDLPTASAQGLLELPTAWLFGSEAHGLPAAVVTAADAAVRVPIYGRAESLNLATAAAVCLYASATAQRAAGVDA